MQRQGFTSDLDTFSKNQGEIKHTECAISHQKLVSQSFSTAMNYGKHGRTALRQGVRGNEVREDVVCVLNHRLNFKL